MKIHPAVDNFKKDFEKGKISRREFIRFTTLLGLSATAAGQMAGLAFPKKAVAATMVMNSPPMMWCLPCCRGQRLERNCDETWVSA